MTYIEVNGLPTWHEIHGAGQPVVLLHAAFAEASSWSAQTLPLVRAGCSIPLVVGRHLKGRCQHGRMPPNLQRFRTVVPDDQS